MKKIEIDEKFIDEFTEYLIDNAVDFKEANKEKLRNALIKYFYN